MPITRCAAWKRPLVLAGRQGGHFLPKQRHQGIEFPAVAIAQRRQALVGAEHEQCLAGPIRLPADQGLQLCLVGWSLRK